MYKIDFDDRLHRISSRRFGFSDSDEATRYSHDLMKMVSKAGKDFDLWIDISEATAFPQDAAILFEQLARDVAATPLRKIAYVNTGAITRMQMQRILPDDVRFRIFTNKQEAEAWLLVPGPA